MKAPFSAGLHQRVSVSPEKRFLITSYLRLAVSRLFYGLVLGAAILVATCVSGADLFVCASNATPVAPYTNWATAATNIQTAVNAASNGDIVWVTNGVYAPLTCTKAITIRSVNGAGATVVDGGGAQRCATFSSLSTVFEGFTLRNGRSSVGGGAYGGTLNNCILTGNTSTGGGGGASGGLPPSICSLNNCIVKGNSAATYGGGTFCCILVSCTVNGNSSGSTGGGACAGYLTNCIVYGNSGGGNYSMYAIPSTPPSEVPIFLDHCCTTPNPPGYMGQGNIVADPLFVSTNDFHLQPGSRCINAGTNLAGMSGGTDLDGNPRIDNGTVDIGAYEFMRGNFNLSDAVDCVALTWTTEGAASVWFPQTAVSSDGSDAAQSGPVPDSGQTWMQTEVASSGTLTFQWRTSCQPLYDALAFYVDGASYALISGETAWQPISVFVGPGAHTFRWVYAKGKSGASGADCGWVDQVAWTPGMTGAVWTLNTVSTNGYGAPAPPVGAQTFTNGSLVSASVTSPWVLTPGVEARACSGWTRTGILPASGTGTNTTFAMTTDATLTWLWRTQYWLQTAVNGGGTVDQAPGWCESGSNVTVVAVADAGWRFDHWSGDMAGAAITNNRITVAMNGARLVTANFVVLDLAEALDTTNLTWTTGGDAPWVAQTAVTWDGIDAARSGAIGNLGMTWMETQVTGPGTLSFQWRCASEAQYDFSYFLVDGLVRSWLTGSNAAWNAVNIDLGEGEHTLRWEYWKDESGAAGADACWVDSVVWISTLSNGFDIWTHMHGLEGARGALFSQDRDGDGVANGFEYAFGTNWTSGQVLMNIRLIDGKPVVEVPRQDTGTVSFVEVALRGCTNLPVAPDGWVLPILPSPLTAGKPANRDWFVPEGQPPKAFFRIEAILRE